MRSQEAMASNGVPNPKEVIAAIRERVRARHAAEPEHTAPCPPAAACLTPAPSAYDLRELHANLAACNALHNAVGTLNPRRPGLHNKVIQFVKKVMRRSLTWYTRPLHLFQGAVTRTLNETTRALEQLRAELADLRSQVKYVEHDLLRSVDTGRGAKAKSGLYFNEPVMVDYDSHGRAYWAATSERIVERSWLFRGIAALSPGVRILDVGSSESLVSLELASSGFKVVGVDIRDYPLQHPNLQFLRADICHTNLATSSFDAAIALSTIEHFGLGFYGDSPDDHVTHLAMQEILRLLKPGAPLFLTAPFGCAAVTPQHRIFDPESLRSLLRAFQIEKLEFGKRRDGKTWEFPVSESDATGQTHDPATFFPGAVALVICRKPGQNDSHGDSSSHPGG
jgi:SAM-dependent methyltransferase